MDGHLIQTVVYVAGAQPIGVTEAPEAVHELIAAGQALALGDDRACPPMIRLTCLLRDDSVGPAWVCPESVTLITAAGEPVE